MKRKILLAATLVLLASQLPTTLYAGEKDVNVVNTPDVNIINPSLQVTGEVTSTVSGDVSATVTNTVEANVLNTVDVNVTNGVIPVDVQNMIDVQSLPAVQIEPNQQIGTIPGLRPGAALSYRLLCFLDTVSFKGCEHENFPSDGGILTHISITPQFSGVMDDTVCSVNIGLGTNAVGPQLVSHSWDENSLFGTSIVLPFSVQMGAPSAVPYIFVSRGSGQGRCVVAAYYHGYMP